MKDIKATAVLGAGTMGAGIAQVFATAGLDVALFDITEEFALAGLKRIQSDLNQGVERGKVTTSERDATLARIRPVWQLSSAAEQADLVVEAAPERLELKTQIFADLSPHLLAHAVLATNTSSISIDKLAAGLAFPERFVGMHFFNPPPRMPLLEIVRGSKTDPDVVSGIRDFAVSLGKQPIVVSDAPGFASSRLGLALGLEAMRMVEEGVASAADIDTAMTLGYRHPMGPLQLTDLIGLDVRLDIAQYLAEHLDDTRFAPPQILIDHVSAGRLGAKSGQGFYTWKDGKTI
ncbi:MAG: 3-hydroxyacyl-CoA dehydrogenase family protein [Planctomycetes bacterium]|jgi:3-hydroxybutyryl-CoA dehydrogenase|nr:3-hydroxyacyl-CoA dehydrogenase family protein [Planctomycetota bacterium]MBT4560838.1 3-hydroxyacyl-CoA dehydrogenase family protein [Planctomycetota bacterium]MBT5101492.1 3-hydroxyacyl-CoA dehydrogenase family protein [Planctomycetota bacterium]MBT5120376.1 3-hydroxyacyl-CoA dehydrogenase family protein [Planctomycetota bacterium]MBT7011751.1 3-hydroxyacyl-CoA dehydrogenase family protein [Planctomycetota bacterium]